MPYFILNYLNPLIGSKNNSFIIEEVHIPLSAEKIASINLLAQEVISKNLPCTSVPQSFPLNPSFHNNTLVILEDVLGALIELLNESDITPDTHGPIQDLNSTINLCLFGANPACFQQDLPSIIPFSKPIEAPSQAITTSLKQSKKRAGSPLITSPHTKKTRLDTETDLLSLINPESFFYEQDQTQLETVTSISNTNIPQPTTEFICIDILEGNKHFQFTHLDPMDPNTYLEHLYQGIDLVLTNQIYLSDLSDKNSQQHSASYLHHQSLLSLLSLLNKQKPILSLILNKDEWTASTAHHELLTKEIILSLQDGGFTEKIIETTQKEPFPTTIRESTDIKIKETDSLSDFIKSPSEVAMSSDTSTEKSLTKENMFLTCSRLNCGIFKIYIKAYNRSFKCIQFIKTMKHCLKKAIGYTCKLNIKEIPAQLFTSRTETLKMCYLVTKNNYCFFKQKTYRRSHTHSKFLLLLDSINNAFCTHVQEPINPSAHSKILLDLIKPYKDPIAKNNPILNCSCTHYQIRLYTNHCQTILYIEKHNSLKSRWTKLLSYKHLRIKCMLKDIKKLLTLSFVTVQATDIPFLTNEDNTSVATLIPYLYLLTKYNQQMFKTYLEPLYPTSTIYPKIYILFEDILKTLTNSDLNKDISFQKTHLTIDLNPLLEINTPPTITKNQYFFGHTFVIHYHKNQYQLKYATKVNQNLNSLKDKLALLLSKTAKYANTLVNSSAINNIIFIPDPSNPASIRKITTFEELFLSLYQGLNETLYYYQKHHTSLLHSSRKHKIFTQFTNAIDAIEKKCILSGINLPSISKASILDQMADHELENPKLKKYPSFVPALAPATISLKKGSSYLLPLLALQKKIFQHSSITGTSFASFTLYYQTKRNTMSLPHVYSHGRYSINKTLENIKDLCHQRNTKGTVFYYQSPFISKRDSINSKEMLILLFKGLTDCMSFFNKYYKAFLLCTSVKNPLINIQEALELVTQALDGEIPSTHGPSILKQILKNKIGKESNPVPSLEDLLTSDDNDIQ
ncbi:hypothetical protein CLAVI_000909 [Candidatus Clavichlamydia salmonicola]|uniref:hypothetical protein n=1 Tax=Candidatus Clavichlamydia salmonicola TaxID=469812 RepID=UPI0018917AEF|nr:hypothetical protein [Candidatus Clavichlamydia salmonicola]MBF5051268.1 hypothetical protein [Candidatus Clavichlamydia salmonicola]